MLVIKPGDASQVPPPWYALIRWTCDQCGCEFQAESSKDVTFISGLVVVNCPTCDMGIVERPPREPRKPWRWPWQKQEEQA